MSEKPASATASAAEPTPGCAGPLTARQGMTASDQLSGEPAGQRKREGMACAGAAGRGSGGQPPAGGDHGGRGGRRRPPEPGEAGRGAARPLEGGGADASETAASGLVRSVLVVGTGLIGTSVALALRGAGVAVWLEDIDPVATELAAALGAGTAARPEQQVDVVVIAAPPDAVAGILKGLQSKDVGLTYTDVCSVKSKPLAEAYVTGADMTSFVGGHPMSGKERSGPMAATADLFVGRPWVLTPTPETAHATLARVESLARLCGAKPLTMNPDAHDAAVALVSHAPHIVAALMAARLADAAESAVALAGPGVADVTRVADGDWRLWTQILTANAPAVAQVLQALRDDLDAAINALMAERQAEEGRTNHDMEDLLRRGIAGRGRLPGKHGGAPTRYAVVPVLVPDRPGELARLFRDAGRAGVNIEDVSIEHAPGMLLGLVELSIRPDAVEPLIEVLHSAGWSIQP